MRRWFAEPTCRFALSVGMRRCSTAASGKDSRQSPRRSPRKKTESFGVDQVKLDLALNLHEMDFDAMVKATRAALAKERMRKETLVGDALHTSEAISSLEKDVSPCAALSSPAPSAAATNPSVAATVDCGGGGSSKLMESQMVCGIVNARGAHTTNSFAVVREQRKAEGARYGLMDVLRDCLLSGNWVKAMHMFETAVETSCKAVQASVPVAAGATSEERDIFETLRRINATTPPGFAANSSSRYPGVLRWRGGHFYLLLKLLLSKHRLTEAERVWDVMKRIGFLEFHMNAYTLNQCMTLARKATSPDIVSPLKEDHANTEDRLKAFRTTFVLELEEWAKRKGLSLDERNKQITRAAHLAEFVKHGKEGGEDKGEVDVLNGEGLKVGDFSGLLRRCHSEASTERVLQMMDKLQVPRDGQVFAALIAALRQPHYRLTAQDETDAVSSTKEEYDAHRRQRFVRAFQWFEACPENERTADVYNEMLQLARGDETADKKFQELLLEFRGAPLSLANTAASTPAPIEDTTKKDNMDNENEVRLLPPRWRVIPNGRTYEVLVSHCKYRQEWRILWALYDEAMERCVKGTQRLYQVLLEVAKDHPPQGRDSNAVVMELYEDMKGCGMDVTGIKSTVNVVNAWCATRRKRRW
ncbi:hypothetical protein TRSC58_03755 [Trypanosoma rangeli SC58]|uniref:Polyadenylation/uridylation factor 2 n=1 Tax=Trypanosoma rangeli SC58 TaxID=429131 RepID=A0A061J2J9_TRYRA|nr:hypothetical protein TRSC58_03755 [Trypanosoma rangeli SC58]